MQQKRPNNANETSVTADKLVASRICSLRNL